ncbi:MAG: rRNA pseudouridine synthase [Chloroflexota bacterium]|nr:MAG: rRNA pseudouridine synthase [Chloroflexota bacterium]
MTENPGERLQKVLARAGVASRRAAEDLIRAGRITVNGEVVVDLGRRVTETDRVLFDGKVIEGEAGHVYIVVNKPIGYVATVRDPRGRPTVMDLIPRGARVYPVGRLDWDSEGLLLMTNDGELTHRLTHPRFGVVKEYHALVERVPSRDQLENLERGIELDDGVTAPAQAHVVASARQGTWVSIAIHEGRNRQVRRMVEAIGHPVLRLIRVRMGPLTIDGLAPGASRPLSAGEVAGLRRIAGLAGGPATPGRVARSSEEVSSRQSPRRPPSLPRRR